MTSDEIYTEINRTIESREMESGRDYGEAGLINYMLLRWLKHIEEKLNGA